MSQLEAHPSYPRRCPLARLARVLSLAAWLCPCWVAHASITHAEPTSVLTSRDVSLRVGEQVSLSAAGVKSYSEGVPGIVEVRLSKEGENFVLLALRPGNTTLLLFTHDGREVQIRVQVASDFVEDDGLRVEVQDNVRLDFYFVQISEGYGHNLGIGYPDSVGGTARLTASLDLVSGTLSQASLGLANQVLPKLDMAQRSGWAKISRQAAVVAENGKQAAFRSGGEVNFTVQGALTAEIRSIQYGSQITVQPRFDRESKRLQLHVGAEISDLTQDSGNPIPGRTLSTLDTVVNLDMGKSLVLAGLDARSESRAKSGLPGLSRIPILGGLFGSHSRRSEDSKNLVFIVPSVVQAVPQRERDLIEEMLQLYESFDGDTRAVELPSSSGPQEAP